MAQPESQDQIVLKPILRSPAQPGARTSATPGGERKWFGLITFGLIVLAVAAVGAFVYLPTLVKAPKPAAPPAAAKPAEPAPVTPPAEVDYQKLAVEMDQAEQARGVYDALLGTYDKHSAAQWAGEPFTAAQAKGEQARKQFEARQYTQAEQSYKAALDDLHRVGEIAQQLLKQQLADGAQALAQGKSEAARKAFEFAQRVDPDNATAARGLKRAGTLDQALALVTAGADAERAGDTAAAEQRYQEALKLDPEITAASEGLARVRSRISADDFSLAMSQGLRALSEGKPADARAAYQRAARIRPDAQEVKDALARVQESELKQSVVAHRQQAESLERGERWEEALAQYDAALKLDPALEFALQGRARVQPRVALDKQMNELIGGPERLLSPAVRTQAHALLAEAGKVQPPGPVLSKQVEQLSAALKQAETPVAVELRSDNQTLVGINRVSQLGTFAERRMDLLPGKYVVVGRRQGYRDVRKELTVLPGEPPPALTVQCEERI